MKSKSKHLPIIILAGMLVGAAFSGCSTLVREYEEDTTRTISQAPVLGDSTPRR